MSSDYKNTYTDLSRRRIVRALRAVRKWAAEVEQYLGSPDPTQNTWDVSGEVANLNCKIQELQQALALDNGGKPHLDIETQRGRK